MASAPLANLGVNAVNPGGDIQGVVAAGQMFGNLARTRMQIAAQQSAQAFGAGTQFLRAEQDAILSEERAKNSLAQKFGFEDFGKLSSAAGAVGQPLNEYMANLESRRMSILNRQQVADEVYRLNTVRPVEMNYDYVRGESMLAAAQLRKMADEKLQYASPEQKAQYQALNSQYIDIMRDAANETVDSGEVRRLFQGVQQQQAQILATIPDPPKSATERWRMAKTPEERQAIAQELVSPIADPKTGETIGFGILDDDPRGGLGLKSLLPVNKLEGADRMHPIAEALLSGEPEKVKAATALIQSGQVPIGNTGAVLTPVIKGNKIEFEVVKPTGGGGGGPNGEDLTRPTWRTASDVRALAEQRVEEDLARINQGRTGSGLWHSLTGQEFKYTPTPEERKQAVEAKMREIIAETRQAFDREAADIENPAAESSGTAERDTSLNLVDARIANLTQQADTIMRRTNATPRPAAKDVAELVRIQGEIARLRQQKSSLGGG